MLIALMVLGIALVAFGALVLMKYSDRPGGTIKWLGLEVTSKGAGLPLIALGVGSIVFAVARFPLASPNAGPDVTTRPDTVTNPSKALTRTGSHTSCYDEFLSKVPGDRVDSVEVGMTGVEIIGSHEKLDGPFALLLTENGQRIGALRIRLYGAGTAAQLYKIEQAIDGCAEVTAMRNTSRGGNPRELQNWDTLREKLGPHEYDVRIGGEGNINVGYFTRVP
ncbi:MAG: hypothetical protein ABIT20_11975 [Gemmatimonadaceae bacterium]